ncbi:MAG: glycosyltransferase family 39 protein [Phycisphaerales bacterium]|nr:MAG: glycosyltransferase family 39 protein [Phycisphaerales bacterium]
MVADGPDNNASCRSASTGGYSIVGLTIVVILAAFLRFAGIGRPEILLDESLSWYCQHHLLDWPADGPDKWRELTSIPYFFLLHVWARLFGDSPTALRSLSALASLITVALLARAASRSYDRTAAIICALLAAVSPLALWYAQLTRVYAFWAMVMALAGLLLFEAARGSRRSTWAWYGLALFAALCTHYFTLFGVPATLACLLVAPNRARTFKRWLTTHAIVGLAFTPVFFALILPVASRSSGAWLADYWSRVNVAALVPMSLAAFIPAGEPPVFCHTLTWSLDALRAAGWGIAAAVAKRCGPIVLLLTVAGLALPRHRSDNTERRGGALAALGYWVVLAVAPLVLAWLYCFAARPNYLVGRYDLVCWPAWIVASALAIRLGAEGLLPRRPNLAAGTLTFVLLLVALVYHGGARVAGLTWGDREASPRRLVSAILQHAGPDAELVMFDDRWFLEYELHRQGFAGSIRSYPPRLDRQIGWRDIQSELADPQSLDREAAQLADAIRRMVDQGRPVWLLLGNYEQEDDPRYRVDRHLFRALDDANITLEIVDTSVGLARLRPVE